MNKKLDIEFIFDINDSSQNMAEAADELDYGSKMLNCLVNDAINHTNGVLEKFDIDQCFYGGVPEYFEAENLPELIDFVKSIKSKISSILLYVNQAASISEIESVIKSIIPYCTEDCVEMGRILFAYPDKIIVNVKKYRIMFLCK